MTAPYNRIPVFRYLANPVPLHIYNYRKKLLTCSTTMKKRSWCVKAYREVPVDVIILRQSFVMLHCGTCLKINVGNKTIKHLIL